MLVATKVLIRLGKSWSSVGTAFIEEDEDSGRKLLHLQMAAMAQDVYLPLEEVPMLARDLDAQEAALLGAAVVGHA